MASASSSSLSSRQPDILNMSDLLPPETMALHRRSLQQEDQERPEEEEEDCCSVCSQQQQQKQDDDDDDATATTTTAQMKRSSNISSSSSDDDDEGPITVRILTWDGHGHSSSSSSSSLLSLLEEHATLYNNNQQQENPSTTEAKIIIKSVPSLQQLQTEVSWELRNQKNNKNKNKNSQNQQQPSLLNTYDAFVVPPLLLGDMYEQGDGLALWTVDEFDIVETSSSDTVAEETTTTTTTNLATTTTTTSLWDDILPYYKYNVATFGGSSVSASTSTTSSNSPPPPPDDDDDDSNIRSIPLFGGSQMMLLFRKDYLDQFGLPTPKTWSDYVEIASQLHNQPIGPLEQPIYGSCIGRMSEEQCRRRTNRQDGDDQDCNSQSMTYANMMIASMTQVGGNTTGYLMDVDADTDADANADSSSSSSESTTASSGLRSLLNKTLEETLVLMEEQMKYGPPDELLIDSSLNMKLFRDAGLCAMTISDNHDVELLNRPNVGFVMLPGSSEFLDRSTNEIVECTDSSCPYGVVYGSGQKANLVPFGSVTDQSVGAVSAHVSSQKQDAAKSFFKSILMTSSSSSATADSSAVANYRQPLTYSELKQSTVPGYEMLMTAVTSSPNSAVPFRIPNALGLLSTLDDQIYNYLTSGNYTQENRQKVFETVDTSWDWTIQMHDAQRQSQVPTSTFYQKSLGVFEPQPAADLYIGDTARYIGWGLAGLSCIFALSMTVMVWMHQNERTIRASQPIFLWMVSIGALLMASSIFPYGIDDTLVSYSGCSIACIASQWLFCLGFACMFSALFSKIWLTDTIFRSAQNQQRIKLTTPDILGPFLVLFGVSLAILIVWTATDMPEWIRLPVDGSTDGFSLVEPSTYGWCESQYDKIYLGIILGIFFVMMIISLVQSYECRKITTEYRETFFIGTANAITAQVWLIGLPLLRLLQDNPRAIYLTLVGIIFVTSFGTLLLVFGPKIPYLLQDLRTPESEKDLDPSETESYSDNLEDRSDDSDSRQSHSQGSCLSNAVRRRNKKPRGVLGIRVVQSSVIHSEEVDTLELSVEKAEKRNRQLQQTLEKMQEKMEQFIVARDPLGISSNDATGGGGGKNSKHQQQQGGHGVGNKKPGSGTAAGGGGSGFTMVGKGVVLSRPGQITAPEPSASFRD